MARNVLALHENYLSTDTFVSMSYSSQKSQMPATNVLAGTRRTKVWRSNGYWEITSSNNQIVFQESDGVDITATIAVVEYTSDSTFLTAIKTALDSAGGSPTYTVTRDTTTNRIKIASDGAGSSIFKLMCTDEDFTAAGIIGFSTSADLTGALTYTADVLKIHTSEWLKFDMGMSVNPKAFIAIGLRNTAFKLSESATIKLQGNTTDNWSNPEYESTLSYTEFGVAEFSDTGLHTEALRYWRLYIEDASNIYGYVEISNIYLGDAVIPEQGSVVFPLRTVLVDLGERTYARSGLSYSDDVQLTEEITFSWQNLKKEEKEELEDFVRNVGLSTPFFIALDPNGVFSQSPERHVRYVKFLDGPSFELVRANSFKSEWRLREEV